MLRSWPPWPGVAGLARPLGLEEGLRACQEPHPSLDTRRVATAARERGVILTTLEGCYAGPRDQGGPGHGELTSEEIGRRARILAQVIRREAEAPTNATATKNRGDRGAVRERTRGVRRRWADGRRR